MGTVIDQAKRFPVPALQVTAILCGIWSGTKKDEDLSALLTLADSRRYFHRSYGGEIVQALVEGWPDSDKLYDLAIQSARQWGHGRELDGEIAKAYLLATSKPNPQRDKDLAGVIRDDRFFFSSIGVFNFRPGNYGRKLWPPSTTTLYAVRNFE